MNISESEDSTSTMRALFCDVPSRCCSFILVSRSLFSSRFILSLSLSLSLSPTCSLTRSIPRSSHFIFPHLSQPPQLPLLSPTFNPFIPLFTVWPTFGFLWHTLAHTRKWQVSLCGRVTACTRTRRRARTRPFENWCHEARRVWKIHGYTYTDAGCTLTRGPVCLSVCARQLITTCASLGKYSVN